MSTPIAGGFLSVGSAICWALAVVLFKRAAEVPALAINLFKNTLALGLMSLTLLALGGSIDMTRSGEDFARLLVSGALGLGFADAVFLHALKGIGPGMAAIVETAYSPSVVLFAVLLNGEALASGFLLGAPLVLGGVLVATEPWRYGRGRPGRTPTSPRHVALGAFAVACMGLGIVIAKPTLERSDVIEASVLRMIGALSFQVVVGLCLRSRRQLFGVLRYGPHWRAILPSALLGAYISMMLWLGGMKLAPASVAAVLGQTSTIFTLLFARVLYAEPLGPARVLGALLAGTGSAIIVIGVG